MRVQEHLAQFIGDAFGADDRDLIGHLADSSCSRWLNVKLKPGCEAHGSQEAQLVLGKSLPRIADRADDAVA